MYNLWSCRALILVLKETCPVHILNKFVTKNTELQPDIYTTKIEEFVCPPNISETVAVRITKPAHRPRIASTTIKLISKPILLSV